MSDTKVVKITETCTGQSILDSDGDVIGVQELTRFEITWPSKEMFTIYVNRNDDVNERRRQEEFAEKRGYTVEWVEKVYTRKKK